jgi:hypothetical protein
MFWKSEADGGESSTKQASLDEVVDDYEPVPREFDWRVGVRAGLKALVVLTIGMMGVLYMIHTDTLHIVFVTSVGTTILLEAYGIADFARELV